MKPLPPLVLTSTRELCSLWERSRLEAKFSAGLDMWLFFLLFLLSAAPAVADPGFEEKYEPADNIFNPTSRYAPANFLNPAQAYAPNNPFNPANRFDPGNPANPTNKYSPNNPFNPANRYNADNPLNPANRFNPTMPFTPLNRLSRPNR